MFVKQIDLKEALRLASKGNEVKVLYPTAQEGGWESLMPDTLQGVLDGCLFFRQEPAMVDPGFEEKVRAAEAEMPPIDTGYLPKLVEQSPPPLTMMEQLQSLPEAPMNRPADVWVPVPNGRR